MGLARGYRNFALGPSGDALWPGQHQVMSPRIR
jgi:hypothetical protein